MKVLIIGGSRFIGREIARRSVEAGHRITLFNRGITDASKEFPAIHGDVENLPHHRDMLLAIKPEIVVHCIAYTEKNAHDCVKVFQHTDTRVIVLGSMDCYDVFQMVNRGKEVSDFPVDEEMPTTPIRYYWRGFQHGKADEYDKNLMTDVFMSAYAEKKIKPTILRLPMVYGPDDYQYRNRHGEAIRRILDRRKEFPMSFLDQTQLGTHGYIENVAAAVVHCFSHPETVGQVYNIGEGKVRTRRRWAELYAKAANWEFEFKILPDEILAKDHKYRNWPAQHVLFDCSRFERETGFKEPVPLEEGIRKTLDWGSKHPESLGPSPNYAEEMTLVAKYEQLVDQFF